MPVFEEEIRTPNVDFISWRPAVVETTAVLNQALQRENHVIIGKRGAI